MGVTRLEIDSIIATAEEVEQKIKTAFPQRGITSLAHRLVEISNETRVTVADLTRPRWTLRIVQAAIAVALLAMVGASLLLIDLRFDLKTFSDLLAAYESLIQDVIFIGIAVVFLMGMEGRRKRKCALAGLYGLRSLAHIIDMHQLAKNPDSLIHPVSGEINEQEKASLAQYLNYCSEMLSITNKLAALYAQESQDSVVLATVGDVQDLTVALSSKVWQKVMILDA